MRAQHTVISNFLDQTECDFLKALSGPELRRSRVTNGRVIENRTSYSTFLTGEKVYISFPHASAPDTHTHTHTQTHRH